MSRANEIHTKGHRRHERRYEEHDSGSENLRREKDAQKRRKRYKKPEITVPGSLMYYKLLAWDAEMVFYIQKWCRKLPRPVRSVCRSMLSSNPLFDLSIITWITTAVGLYFCGWNLFWSLSLNVFLAFFLSWIVGGRMPGDIDPRLQPLGRVSPTGFPCIEIQLSVAALCVMLIEFPEPPVVFFSFLYLGVLLFLRLFGMTHFIHQLLFSIIVGGISVPTGFYLSAYWFPKRLHPQTHLIGAVLVACVWICYVAYKFENDETILSRIPRDEYMRVVSDIVNEQDTAHEATPWSGGSVAAEVAVRQVLRDNQVRPPPLATSARNRVTFAELMMMQPHPNEAPFDDKYPRRNVLLPRVTAEVPGPGERVLGLPPVPPNTYSRVSTRPYDATEDDLRTNTRTHTQYFGLKAKDETFSDVPSEEVVSDGEADEVAIAGALQEDLQSFLDRKPHKQKRGPPRGPVGLQQGLGDSAEDQEEGEEQSETEDDTNRSVVTSMAETLSSSKSSQRRYPPKGPRTGSSAADSDSTLSSDTRTDTRTDTRSKLSSPLHMKKPVKPDEAYSELLQNLKRQNSAE